MATTKKKVTAAPKPKMPRKIYANVSPRSMGNRSLFDESFRVDSTTVDQFRSTDADIDQTVDLLKQYGFDILQVGQYMINIAGTKRQYEKAFNTTLEAQERPVLKPSQTDSTATFIECTKTTMAGLITTEGSSFERLVEGVAIEEPRYFMEHPFPPQKPYWHLNVPAGVSLGVNADRAHRGMNTGKGCKIAMVDSGWYKHPFFTHRGYRVQPVTLGPGASNPLRDESGHGTGESANIFAVAPDVTLYPVKMNFANSLGSFNAAVALNPDVITCSWGSSRPNSLSAADLALGAAIAAAVASGIIVVFSAGNGHWGYPGQHPDVISAGGVHWKPDNTLEASDYSSGFMSNIYSGRRVPDLSGLVGMRPRAAYIMLPVEPNDNIDNSSSGGTWPNGDETASNDGWAVFSGTSAAAPQIAGAAALVKKACPRLTPAGVRSLLMRTARDVRTGNCHPNTGGNPAVAGPDTATGNGLLNTYRAVLFAKLRCLRPITPIQPIQPIRPIGPVQPITPIQPVRPIQPISPIRPIQPISPIRPVVSPQSSDQEYEGFHSDQESPSPTQHGMGLTDTDISALEEMADNDDMLFDEL